MIRHLLIPGLLGPAPEGSSPLPALPRLEALFARADKVDGPAGFANAAFDLFGVPHVTDADLPTAALCYAYQTGSVPQQYVLHADPVHLCADRDSLLLFDAGGLVITDEEAATFERAFNTHFSADGFRLHAASARDWYLLVDSDPEVVMRTLGDVSGRDVNAFLPVGPKERDWRRLLNETQMLFHSMDVNQAREASGEPAVNGLWFSGGGRMPDRGRSSIAQIQGKSLLVNALVGHTDVAGKDELWVDDGAWRALLRADQTAWVDTLVRFDGRLDDHLADAETCWLHACNGVSYRWRAGMRRRFWRRPRPFADVLSSGA